MIKLIKEAKENDIYPLLWQLPATVYGFVYKCSKGSYHVIINNRLTSELQSKVLEKGVDKINNGLESGIYIIGLDMQQEDFEEEFDDIASEFVNNLLNDNVDLAIE